jgi:maltose alpha-D-glucosyltransferase/alpha-amylase
MLLPRYLAKQSWFSGKAGRIDATRIADWGELAESAATLVLVEVQYESGEPDEYMVPLAMTYGPDADRLRQNFPNSILSSVVSHRGRGLLHDAACADAACAAALSLIESAGQVQTRRGRIRGVPGAALSTLRGAPDTPLPPVRGSKEQSTMSVTFGDRLILKMFRRQQPGPNPEAEIGRYLAEKAAFDGMPGFAGTIEYQRPTAEDSTLAMLQGFVANEGDGWTLALEELERYYENCARVPLPEDIEGSDANDLIAISAQPPSQQAHDYVGIALDSLARLGRRTAALHLALAAPSEDPAFSPEPLTSADIQSLLVQVRERAAGVFDVLRDSVARLPDEMLDLAGLALGRRKQILDSLRYVGGPELRAQRTRIHGDYHLGQVLRVRTDYVILGFEGEPARPLKERRAKHSPLKDVVGMLRSLAYAAYVGLINYTARRPEDFKKLEPWARLWERSTAAEFLRAYREIVSGTALLPSGEEDLRGLLALYWLDRVLYELSYELNNRPGWAHIPLIGILSLPIEAGGREWNSTPLRNRR